MKDADHRLVNDFLLLTDMREADCVCSNRFAAYGADGRYGSKSLRTTDPDDAKGTTRGSSKCTYCIC